MRILFCQGGERWKIDDCGKAYTSGSFDERIWERYKLYGSELTVMFAEERKRYNSGLLPTKYNFFDETKYNRISLVDEINPKVNTFNILIKKRNRDIIYKAVKDADVIIIRSLGTFVTNSTFKIANKLNKPIITEVTGPIFEGNYYGGFFSRMLAVSREWSAKKLNSVAKYTLYVTKNALQERYPNAGIMVGISDVYLPEVDIKKIVEKRSRKNNAEKVVFGTAGSTSLPRKGHKYVIKALGILKREGITNIEYHMAGGGDEADIIKQAKKENVLEMIHFDGTIPASEMSTFYDNIDVYICSSMAEVLCRSVVEAMGRGCGVICTRVCGNVELADKEFLYEKKDFGTLAKLMKKMMDRKVLSEQMLLSLSKSKNYEKNVLDTKRDEFYLDAINSILLSLN